MRRALILFCSISLVAVLAFPGVSCCEEQKELVEASPKSPWGEFKVVEVEEPTLFGKILLWLPNRVLDFIDIFRLDAGVGVSYGAVVRTSRYVQGGYRKMSPWSFRVGNFGRKAPYLLEKSPEYGLSPYFTPSKQREVCSCEFGLGADLFIAGAYGGICLEEAADFLAGIFTYDLMDDDLENGH